MSAFNKRISTQINGSRSYDKEARVDGYESPQNGMLWTTREAGSVQDFDTMLETAPGTGGAYTTLGDTNDQTITSTSGSLSGHQKWSFYNYVEAYKFTNIGEHPLHLILEEYVCKQSRALEGAIACAEDQFFYDFQKGYDQHRATGSAVGTTGATDTGIITAASTNSLISYSNTLSSTNAYMQKFWKRLKRRKIKMNPGDEAEYKCRVKNIVYDPERYKHTTEDSDDIDMIKGVTKIVLWRFYGPLGRSSVAGEHAIVGLMKCDLGVERRIKAKFIPLLASKKQRYNTLVFDDLTGKTLVGPTEHALLDDAN